MCIFFQSKSSVCLGLLCVKFEVFPGSFQWSTIVPLTHTPRIFLRAPLHPLMLYILPIKIIS